MNIQIYLDGAKAANINRNSICKQLYSSIQIFVLLLRKGQTGLALAIFGQNGIV